MAAMWNVHRWLVAGFALAAVFGLAGRVQAQELTIGTIGASSDAPLFIADAMGYYAEQGLKVKFVRFDSAAKMIPSLGSAVRLASIALLAKAGICSGKPRKTGSISL